MKSTQQILKAAYDLLKDPKHWTQGTQYRNKYEFPCHPKEAVSFCAVGAIFCQLDTHHYDGDQVAIVHLQQASWMLFGKLVQVLNDDLEPSKKIVHQNVLRVYEKALELCENDFKS